jgi:hypothetical protein
MFGTDERRIPSLYNSESGISISLGRPKLCAKAVSQSVGRVLLTQRPAKNFLPAIRMDAPKSWANVAETEKILPVVQNRAAPKVDVGTKCAVLDASAIIGGCSMGEYAEKLFTTPEVHSEVQDKQSKQTLAGLPFGISIEEPGEDSITAGEDYCKCLKWLQSGLCASASALVLQDREVLLEGGRRDA